MAKKETESDKPLRYVKVKVQTPEGSHEIRHAQILRPARLKALGYTPNEVDSKGRVRSWKAPNGRVLTKYQAYRKIGAPMVNRREWARVDTFEGKERAALLKRFGFKLHREPELY